MEGRYWAALKQVNGVTPYLLPPQNLSAISLFVFQSQKLLVFLH